VLFKHLLLLLLLLQQPAAAAVVCVLLCSSTAAVLPISTALGAESDLVCQGREVAWPPITWRPLSVTVGTTCSKYNQLDVWFHAANMSHISKSKPLTSRSHMRVPGI
jgi:hypothetical protein